MTFFSDDDIDTSRIMIKSNNGGTTNHDTLNDLDSEEAALHEFDFLSGDAAQSTNINELKSNGKSSAGIFFVPFYGYFRIEYQ